MSPRRLLALLISEGMATLSIAVLAQASRANTSNSDGNLNFLTNEATIEMAAAKLPQEVIVTKTRTSKTNFELSTPAHVEQNSSAAIRS